MKDLRFKIEMECLVLKNWSGWEEVDQDYILMVASTDRLEAFHDNDGLDTMTFKGKPEALFEFMHDIAYRYDIELI